MIKKSRFIIRAIFFAIMFVAIIKYIYFVNTGHGRSDIIEILCPIGGFYSLVMWFKTGFVDHIHPAGMIFILAGIITTLFCMKGFCGWICPVGTFLDSLTFIREKIVGQNVPDINMPPKLKFILENFLYLIKFGTTVALVYFIVRLPGQIMPMIYQSTVLPEDVSLYKFWIDAFDGKHNITLGVIVGILVFSYFIPRFWCRYLCPLGAFYGIFNIFSFLRLKKEDSCTNCKLCNKECPMGLSPYTSKLLNNTRCIACLNAMEKCPNHSLSLSFLGIYKIKPIIYPLILVLLYLGIIGFAVQKDMWTSKLSPRMYAKIFMQHGIMKPWMVELLRKDTKGDSHR
ncbi:4Fe-4S binding protein [Desulfohalobiaceae bacterium Ax17]|uniref:4Fe-4S binding protein n=1 Tax=Desulfovulcanus ferrireducens TaxID=2831190 RepID=UPI00207B9ED2|nr:4Fe-4S binding protein [Desulfovulcanus ferrireducens]MBT8763872.1 4Fe-4S binding protein [Desulfovulcanus ferrireducens]